MQIKSFFHPTTFTLTYLVFDEKTKDAVLIDSVLDYDVKSSTLSFTSANLMIDEIKKLELNLHYLLETHAHADHLSASSYFQKFFPKAKMIISEKIADVQNVFKDVFQLNKKNDGSQFDKLIKDNEVISAGSINIKSLATPGHTPACMSFVINDEAVFTGDLLFAPDYGTGRCDFPAGSSEQMYDSIMNKIYSLDENIMVYPGHDYMPGGRIVRIGASLREHKGANIHIDQNTSKEQFVSFRDARDRSLAAPNLLLQSVQFNAWASEQLNEKAPFLKIPIRIKD